MSAKYRFRQNAFLFGVSTLTFDRTAQWTWKDMDMDTFFDVDVTDRDRDRVRPPRLPARFLLVDRRRRQLRRTNFSPSALHPFVLIFHTSVHHRHSPRRHFAIEWDWGHWAESDPESPTRPTDKSNSKQANTLTQDAE